jgi:hypothetical protein
MPVHQQRGPDFAARTGVEKLFKVLTQASPKLRNCEGGGSAGTQLYGALDQEIPEI